MSAKRPVPRASIVLRLEPEQLQALDAMRGETSRNAWIEETIARRLEVESPITEAEKAELKRIKNDLMKEIAPMIRPCSPPYGSRLKKR